MKYGYEQEMDYIGLHPEWTYQDVAPPPQNDPHSHTKLWRIQSINSFLHWYNRRCDYVEHVIVPNQGPIVIPPFYKRYINFVSIANPFQARRPYQYVMTFENNLL
jgi:hypothetical protein